MKTITPLIVILSCLLSYFSMAQCNADFSYTLNGNTVNFSNASTNFNSFMWDFGDGTFNDSVQDPTHAYAGPGAYQVCLFVQDSVSGCTSSHCDSIVIDGTGCNGMFLWFDNGLEVIFHILPGSFDSLSWDFGDGTTAFGQDTIYTYASEGTYQVCLFLYDSTSVCDSVCQLVTVIECYSDFTYSINGFTVNFENLSPPSLNTYWDFGDGGTSAMANPVHTYAVASTYQVCLTVNDDMFNCFQQYCTNVTIEADDEEEVCEAAFTYEANELEVNFTNLSTGDIMINAWSFGGEGISADQNPSFTFEGPGTYEVCLTIGNIFTGCFDIYCESITVNEYTCDVSFSYSGTGQQISFENTSEGDFDSIFWDLGDGQVSTFESPIYTYNEPGIYEVCLTLFDGENTCGFACNEINVWPTGTEENLFDNTLRIFPNPAEAEVEIRFSQTVTSPRIITIMDLTGRMVAQSTMPASGKTVRLDISGLSPGFYTVVVDTEKSHQLSLPLVVR